MPIRKQEFDFAKHLEEEIKKTKKEIESLKELKEFGNKRLKISKVKTHAVINASIIREITIDNDIINYLEKRCTERLENLEKRYSEIISD